MEHIQNMGYSLRAMQSLYKLIEMQGWSPPIVYYYQSDYDFFNVHDYIVEIKKYLLTQSDKELLKKTLRQHFDILKSIHCEIPVKIKGKTIMYCSFDEHKLSHCFVHHADKGNVYVCVEKTHADWECLFVCHSTGKELCKIEDFLESNYNSAIDGEDFFLKICRMLDELQSLLYGASEEIDNTKPPTNPTTIPESLLNDLAAENLITKEPLKWVASVSLCAYFVDNYFTNHSNLWAIGEEMFQVKNLAQSKDNYLGNTNGDGKPRKYHIIDAILLKNK
jgi:hypothetical protein